MERERERVGLFSKNVVTCPLCSYEFGKKGVSPMHFFEHVIPADDGGGGYIFECSLCGERDGVWDQKWGAAAGVMLHCQQRHGLLWP